MQDITHRYTLFWFRLTWRRVYTRATYLKDRYNWQRTLDIHICSIPVERSWMWNDSEYTPQHLHVILDITYFIRSINILLVNHNIRHPELTNLKYYDFFLWFFSEMYVSYARVQCLICLLFNFIFNIFILRGQINSRLNLNWILKDDSLEWYSTWHSSSYHNKRLLLTSRIAELSRNY